MSSLSTFFVISALFNVISPPPVNSRYFHLFTLRENTFEPKQKM